MESFVSYLNDFKVPENRTGVFWLGQAGFIFKSPKGDTIAVDPYFSDCCYRYVGYRRMIPYLMTPYDKIFDGIFCTHAHYDHFDPDGIPLALSNDRTELFAGFDCKAECERLHIIDRVTYIKAGDKVSCAGFEVTAVMCDHGPDTPDAVGLFINTGNAKIYIMGDTCFRADLLENPLFCELDLLILPINGAFGNLNEEEACRVCKILKPGLAVPCHFGNFAEHGGDPGKFANIMNKELPEIAYRIMRVGEGINI